MAREYLSAEKLIEIEDNFRQWIDQRVFEQRPISHRFASRLINEFSSNYQISQEQAKQYFLNWGLNRILMLGPTAPDFPEQDNWLRETARWLWSRRDL